MEEKKEKTNNNNKRKKWKMIKKRNKRKKKKKMKKNERKKKKKKRLRVKMKKKVLSGRKEQDGFPQALLGVLFFSRESIILPPRDDEIYPSIRGKIRVCTSRFIYPDSVFCLWIVKQLTYIQVVQRGS